ncbi:MAG TPA: hypothetical protein VFP39_04305, partial [Gemmatimonadales bacterium]|nr:hypothetical protein [Gemmatimonadales bacterium]
MRRVRPAGSPFPLLSITAGLLAAMALSTSPAVTARAGGGYFDQTTDVGSPAIPGSTVYDASQQTYTLTGAGTNMWAARDEYHFAYRKLSGNFILRAHVKFPGQGVEPHRKLGWIVRSSLDPSATYADVAVHGNGLTSLQYRREQGGQTYQLPSMVSAPDVVQLERNGKMFIMSVARYGEPFRRTELSELDLGNDVYVGLFVCSHNPKVS